MQLFEIVHAQTAIWTNIAAATKQKQVTHCVKIIIETKDGLKNLIALLLNAGWHKFWSALCFLHYLWRVTKSRVANDQITHANPFWNSNYACEINK